MKIAYSAALLAALAAACMTSVRPETTKLSDDASAFYGPAVFASEAEVTSFSFFAAEPSLSPCPDDSVLVSDSVCVDLYEAPNKKGERPTVMVDALEAEAWCSERGKRLCTEDEWTAACEGPGKWPYPYGLDHEPGRCNDDKLYRGRQEDLLNQWPGRKARREVARLWQGDRSGERGGCVSAWGVHDTLGNVEEWTRSRKASENFGHVLKGRFWAGEKYACQWGVRSHADKFRYYEVGFRCCQAPNIGH
jgi:hypothetical protein